MNIQVAEDLEEVCAVASLSRKSKACNSSSCLNCTDSLQRPWIELALLFTCVLFLLLKTKPFYFPLPSAFRIFKTLPSVEHLCPAACSSPSHFLTPLNEVQTSLLL